MIQSASSAIIHEVVLDDATRNPIKLALQRKKLTKYRLKS